MRNLKLPLLLILIGLFNYNAMGQSVKVSSFGVETDHSTAFIRAMESDQDTIIMDNIHQAWVLKPIILKEIQNKVIILEKGVEIHAKSGAFQKTSDALLTFIQCNNIKIYGNEGIMCMNKAEYTEGEWRHLISLRSCRDFHIQDLTVRDSGGDGIYIAGYGRGSFSENIVIDNVLSLNNKRQGISIISGKNILISNSRFSDTSGTLPGAGLDIEPNNENDVIVDIRVDACTFSNNYHSGVMLALGKLKSSSLPVSIYLSNSILRNNHSPEHPRSASEIIINANKDSPVKGEVVFENCVIENSKWGIFYSRKRADAFSVSFKNCIARNICQNASWPPILLEVPDYRNTTGPLGGFSFENLYLEYTHDIPVVVVQGSRFGTLENLKDFRGDITIKGGSSEYFKYVNYNPEANVNVKLDIVNR